MKLVIIGLMLSGLCFGNSETKKAVDAVEFGYNSRCSEVFRRNPSFDTDRTTVFFKCTSSNSKYLLLTVGLYKSLKLERASIVRCNSIKVINNFFTKRVLCN